MRHLSALWKREWLETLRDPKRIILLVLFLFFGLLSPLTAKLTPELIKMMTGTSGMGGVQIILPTPDLFSAYEQFLKNISQLLLFAVVLVFMGSISQEKMEGTAALVLTKGVSRPIYIFSRLSASLAVITLAYWLSACIFLLYTQFLFQAAIVSGTWAALLMMWLYLLFAGAVTLLASTLSRTPSISALIAFGILFALMAISGLPGLRDWSPILLSSLPTRALDGLMTAKEALRPIMIGILSIVACWAAASWSLSRQEL